MHRLMTLLVIAALLGLVSTAAMALNDNTNHNVNLNVDEVAEIADVAAGDITLTLVAPVDGAPAGAPGARIEPVTDDSKWLNYTSVVNTGEQRTITAEVTNGPAPTGTSLDIVVLSITEQAGVSGNTTAGGRLIVDNAPDGAVTIVDSIGSCWTGTGTGNGANVEFTFYVSDYSTLVADEDSTVTITYTLTDGA